MWIFWGLVAVMAALALAMVLTRSDLRTWTASSGLTLGVGQGCLFVGRVPALAGKGSAGWAGIYPEWRFRWHTYPGGGWGLFVPVWALLILAGVCAALVLRAARRRLSVPAG